MFGGPVPEHGYSYHLIRSDLHTHSLPCHFVADLPKSCSLGVACIGVERRCVAKKRPAATTQPHQLATRRDIMAPCKVRSRCRLPSLPWDSLSSLPSVVGRCLAWLWSGVVVRSDRARVA